LRSKRQLFAHVVTIGFMSKRHKAAKSIHRAAEGYASARRTRLNESRNIEHLHSELLNQGDRIEELRAVLGRKKNEMRALLSKSEAKLANNGEAHGGSMR
jgi:hypothetical protein